MYNKLFTSILDSSIWLEPNATRIVWVTLLAAMDEDGFVRMATVKNLASRARVSEDEAEDAVECLELPDMVCSGQERDGRRIERVEGGWMVLNSKKYRDLVTREKAREQTRIRVAKLRAKRAAEAAIAEGRTPVTECNEKVTPSEANAEANTSTPKPPKGGWAIPESLRCEPFEKVWAEWVPYRRSLKSCKDWDTLFKKQLEWLEQFPLNTAVEIVNQSLRNAWKGLFELNRDVGKPKPKSITERDADRLVAQALRDKPAYEP